MRAPDAPREPRAVVRTAHRLTFAPGCAGWPSFAPDGRTLVYHGDAPDGGAQLYALDLASGSPRQLTWPPGVNQFAEVSPDGRWVAYVHYGDRLQELRVLPVADSGAPRTIGLLPMGGKATRTAPAVDRCVPGHGRSGRRRWHLVPGVSGYA